MFGRSLELRLAGEAVHSVGLRILRVGGWSMVLGQRAESVWVVNRKNGSAEDRFAYG